jgi:O-antigen/teichoic acid export membrane protein
VNPRAILMNFASMASLRLGVAGLTFALFWLLSHRLSAPQLGGFSLLMNIFFIAQALPLLGMNVSLMRRIAAHPQDAASETSSAFYFTLPITALIGLGLAIAGRWYVDEGLLWAFGLVGLSIVPTGWTVVAECVLVGREQMHWIAYVNLLEAFGRLVGGWVAVSSGYGLTGIFVVFLTLRIAAALAYLLSRQLPAPQWRLVPSNMMKLYRQEIPTFLAIAVITVLCTRADVLLVAKLFSLQDAGIYAAAARLSDAALMVPTMAAVVIFPTQARLFESDRAAFARFLEEAVRWCLVVGFAFALLVVALSPAIIHLIYAPRLASAAGILQILIMGAALMVIDQLLSTTMLAGRAQQADLRSMSMGLAALLTLFLVFGHFFGLTGCAIAIPTALLIRVSYRLYWAQRLFSSRVLWLALRILACAGTAVAVFVLRLTSGVTMDLALALLSYAFVLWVTGSVRATHWRELRHIFWQRRSQHT